MSTRVSPVGAMAKWVVAPILVAALGYFLLAPTLGRGASNPDSGEDSVRPPANPEITIDSEASPSRGPEVSFSAASDTPKPKRRRRQPKPVEKPPETAKPEPVATEPTAPEPPPADPAGIGGAATPGGEGTTGGETGETTTGSTTGGDAGTTGATTGTTTGSPTTRSPGRSANA